MDYISGWCTSHRRLDGITAIVTGCNTGIGKETAADFYHRGARVIMACRDTEKAEIAKKDIETHETGAYPEGPKGILVVHKLDLSSLKSVREFAFRVLGSEDKINILVNNAGVMMCPEGRTEDGFETHIGTNHFGHALLTLMLLPRITKCAPSRIVCVSSMIHDRHNIDLDDINFKNTPYDPVKAYCRSKCANILFAKTLANKLQASKIKEVTTYSLHPGVIFTEIGRHLGKSLIFGGTWFFNNILAWFVKSPRCGAQTTIYCAMDENCAQETGLYYSDCAVKNPSKFCQDEANAEQFWNLTIELLNLNNYDPFGILDPVEHQFS